MWQVDQELLATGKNVLKPKQFSKRNPQNPTRASSHIIGKVFTLRKKGLGTEASALGHTIQHTMPSLIRCLMSCNITATIMQDLTQKTRLLAHESQLLCVLCFCLAALAILLFEDCWLCYCCLLIYIIQFISVRLVII